MDRDELISYALVYGIYAFSALFLIWGWIRCSRSDKTRHVPSWCAFSSFVLGTASAALGVITFVWSHVHEFPYFDPQLMFMFRLGALLSAMALLVSLGGFWRRNALRWHAPMLAIGTMLIWAISAAGE